MKSYAIFFCIVIFEIHAKGKNTMYWKFECDIFIQLKFILDLNKIHRNYGNSQDVIDLPRIKHTLYIGMWPIF